MNGSITVRLSPQDLILIDKKVKEGYYTSRSDVIRYSIRHTLREYAKKDEELDILSDIASSRSISMKKVRKAIRTEHDLAFEDVYGK